MTWVVGLALIADLYEPAERGRATGIVMSGASSAFMIGPSLGGWLYEAGGARLPFLCVAAMAGVARRDARAEVAAAARRERASVLAVVGRRRLRRARPPS